MLHLYCFEFKVPFAKLHDAFLKKPLLCIHLKETNLKDGDGCGNGDGDGDDNRMVVDNASCGFRDGDGRVGNVVSR